MQPCSFEFPRLGWSHLSNQHICRLYSPPSYPNLSLQLMKISKLYLYHNQAAEARDLLIEVCLNLLRSINLIDIIYRDLCNIYVHLFHTFKCLFQADAYVSRTHGKDHSMYKILSLMLIECNEDMRIRQVQAQQLKQ